MEAGGASKRKIDECGVLLRDAPGVVEAIAVVEAFRSAHAARLRGVRAAVEAPAVQMEDIAGVRAVLPSQEQVLHLAAELEHAPYWTQRRKRMYIDGGDPLPHHLRHRA